jgi:hypothetical protein
MAARPAIAPRSPASRMQGEQDLTDLLVAIVAVTRTLAVAAA